MNQIRKVTHILAGVAVAVWGFILSPAGQAVLKQYPKAAALAAGVTTVLALYHQPAKP